MTPESRTNDSALRGEERIGEERMQHATSTRDVLACQIDRLRERGITNPDQWSSLGADALKGTVDWYDAERTYRQIGTGVLISELKTGGKPGWRPSVTAGQSATEYAAAIASWLSTHFPDLTEPTGNPHPAAVVEVIHLHHELGKGRLLPREHRSRIRSAVRRFNDKWDYNPTKRGSS